MDIVKVLAVYRLSPPLLVGVACHAGRQLVSP
jgi:hypothetical protein